MTCKARAFNLLKFAVNREEDVSSGMLEWCSAVDDRCILMSLHLSGACQVYTENFGSVNELFK